MSRSVEIGDTLASHRGQIFAYILCVVRDRAKAEDLTQETFLRAHRKLPTLQDPEKLVGWLYRIATNICRDRFRQDRYRNQEGSLVARGGSDVEPDGDPDAVDTGPRLDKVLEQKEMSACVLDYLAVLPDPYRAVILLHDVEGSTNPEIAKMLGVSLATVKIRLHRARKKLREALAEACSFSTDERGVVVCEPKPLKIGKKPGSS